MKIMDKENVYLLQKIDCNCNDCGYMRRDMAKQKQWENFHRGLQQADFDRAKSKAIADAEKKHHGSYNAGR